MEFTFSEAEERFRQDVRSFLADAVPADMAKRGKQGFHATPEDLRAWHKILNTNGWTGASWPAEAGGPGWTLLQREIFQRELSAADAPQIQYLGVSMVGPVIYTFGSAAQKKTYLPAILNGDILFCQGFSEPNAGSDLASLTTTAVRDGDEYIVNGVKTWTSDGHFADMMFTLVRTDQTVKPQQGISFILIDMKAPGVTVRPLMMYSDELTVNETRLENVRVPAENLIGEPGKGWTYAKFLLSNERALVAQAPQLRRELENIRKYARQQPAGLGTVHDSTEFRLTAAKLDIELKALHWQVMRVLCGDMENADATTSVLKIRGSELQQQVSRLAIEVLGPDAAPYYGNPDDVAARELMPLFSQDFAAGKMTKYLFRRAVSIFGGSAEIQHGLIARLLWKL